MEDFTCCPWCELDSAGNHAVGCPFSASTTAVTAIQHINIDPTTAHLKKQLDILGELLHDIRNLDPLIEQMPGWQKAVESGALDGWV